MYTIYIVYTNMYYVREIDDIQILKITEPLINLISGERIALPFFTIEIALKPLNFV